MVARVLFISLISWRNTTTSPPHGRPKSGIFWLSGKVRGNTLPCKTYKIRQTTWNNIVIVSHLLLETQPS